MGRGKSKKDYQFWDSLRTNQLTYRQYYNRLTELATAMFEWKNLPDTVDERFLEMTLFSQGYAIFFEDKDLGYLALKVATSGRFNVYNIPIYRRAYASNGYNRKLSAKNSVLIYNNYIHTNSMLDVQMFSARLSDLDRTIDVNARAQKTPILVRCSETQRLTLENTYMQYDGNQPFIFADKNFDPNDISVLTTTAPYVADKLYTLKTELWNEALTYLGISNVNITKKERLITDEVQRNQGGTMASRYSRLEMRRKACDEINRMFGLNISVDYRDDVRVQYEDQIDMLTEGDVKPNEQVHN